MLNKKENEKKYSLKGFEIWVLFTVALFIISLYIRTNQELVSFLYNESTKYEIGKLIIDNYMGFITPIQEMLNLGNGLLCKIQLTDLQRADLLNPINWKNEIIDIMLVIINLINFTIGSILWGELWQLGKNTQEK